MYNTLEGMETSPTQVKPTILCLDSWILLRTDRLLENVHASWVHGCQVIFPIHVQSLLQKQFYNSASEH